MKYVEPPNLPYNSTKIVLIGEKYSKLLQNPLKSLGISTIIVPANPNVDPRLSSHADLSIIHLGSNKIMLASYLKGSVFSNQLIDMGFELRYSNVTQSEKYPYDAMLNACILGNKIICNPKSTEPSLVDYLTNDGGMEIIQVKQGYTKCSICVLRDNAIITSDAGIYNRVVESGISALKIDPGYIQLDGFDYGFIGGASFKISDNIIAFTGHFNNHPDKNRIIDFLSLHNIKPVYITEKPMFDVGSLIQIVEK